MVHVPLVPKPKDPENFDVSHILQDTFQDFIDPDEFSKNIVKNVCKYNVKNENLKKTGEEVTAIYDGAKLCMDDIGHTEHQLMVSQAKHLKQENEANYPMLFEQLKLTREGVYEEVTDVKHELLRKTDLLPSKVEMSMDFGQIDLDLLANRSVQALVICLNLSIVEKLACKMHVVGKSALIIMSRLRVPFQQQPETKKIEKKLEVAFKAEPSVIEFLDYHIGKTYSKNFKLINVTSGTRSFAPNYPSKCSPFKVELRSGALKLVSGMSAIFRVKYSPKFYKDMKEELIFRTCGEDVVVTLRSYRTPPQLVGFIYNIFQITNEDNVKDKAVIMREFSEDRRLALNSSIDCGGCLLGYKLDINISLENRGNDGKFFLLTEDQWYLGEITLGNPPGQLTFGPFTIYPTYFEIKSNQEVTLNVQFFANDFGLSVEKLFLLCDNNTCEELEIIGDGVIFDKTNLVIDLELIPRPCLKARYDSKYNFVLNYDQVIPNYQYTRIVTVYNNSCINYDYNWIFCDSICNKNEVPFNKLNHEWISITNCPRFLRRNDSTSFEVVLLCPLSMTGLYSSVLILQVLGIPEESLVEDVPFRILDSFDDNSEPRIFDIVIAEIEILANFVEMKILFNPSEIKVEGSIEIYSSVKRKINVTALCNMELKGQWAVSNANIIEVYPREIFLPPNITVTCDVRIQVLCYENINESVTFVISNSSFTKTFDLHVKVATPRARFLKSYLNFGVIPKGHLVPSTEIHVQNTGFDSIEWLILECAFDFNQRKVVYFNPLTHLSYNKGILPAGQTSTIEYTISSTTQTYRWVSFLILVSIYPTQMAMDSVCLITYEVEAPNIKIHSALSRLRYIFFRKLLYLQCATNYRLCVHNIGEHVAGSFVFGAPQGQHANYLNLTFVPKCGVVYAKSCVHVVLTVVPLKIGVIDEVEIPCYIESIEHPIILKLVCVVDDIHLNYYLPDNHEKFIKIFWPIDVKDMKRALRETRSKSLTEPFEGNLELEYNSLEESERSSSSDRELFEISSDYNFSCESVHESSSERSSSASDMLQVPLKEYLSMNADANLLQYCVEFHAVELRTPVKKIITIENVTPVLGNFHICASNFHPIYPEETKEKLFIRMLEDIKIKRKSNEWEELVNPNYGIVVKFNPSFGSVSSVTPIDVEVWVYANTWGAYVEEVTVFMNDIKPFYFNILVEVVGIPLEYPISLNSLLPETVIRFGTFPYTSNAKKRILKVKNFSCVPIHVVWHTFLKGGRPTHFNLLMETLEHSSTSGSNSNHSNKISTKMLITNKYHGVQDSTIFQVNPLSIKIKPKETKEVQVTFDPSVINVRFDKTELDGFLVGYIHLNDKYKKSDVELGPTKVKLMGTLELPLLELQLLRGDLKMFAYANDIIEKDEIRYQRNLIFRNNHKADAEVAIHIDKPFKVVTLRTVHARTEKKYCAASVPYGYCLQVLVECLIDAEQVLRYSDMVFNAKTKVFPEIVNLDNNSVIIKRNLEIHQSGIRVQVVPMQFTIYYPFFKVSRKILPFDVVFIGNTKKNILMLFNTTGNKIPFSVHKQPNSTAFEIIPSSGVIPKSNGRVPMATTLEVNFTPSETSLYHETIKISSNIPLLHVNVILTGSGTHDQKFLVEGM